MEKTMETAEAQLQSQCNENIVWKPEQEIVQRKFSAASCATLNPVAQLCGVQTLKEALHINEFESFAKKTICYEILPAMGLAKVQRLVIMQSMEHCLTEDQLDSPIAPHCVRPQAWKNHALPILCAYIRRYNHLPKALLMSLSAQLICDKVQLKTLHTVLSNTKLWGVSLSQMAGLESAVQSKFLQIEQQGVLQMLHNTAV